MAENQTNHGFETLLVLDDHGPGPLHARLRRALRAAIAEGRIPAGSAVPPSRVLAADLGCSRWVVTEAYAQLAAEGYLEARSGSATRVRGAGTGTEAGADRAGEVASAGSGSSRGAGSHHGAAAGPRSGSGSSGGAAAGPGARSLLLTGSRSPSPSRSFHSASPRFDLSPGLPDLRMFPRKRWIEALQRAMHDAPHTDLGHGDPAGHPALRATLAEHLTRSRGASVAAEHVTICGGTTDGLVRMLTAMRRAGHTALGVEDPGWDWPAIRALITGAGLTAFPIPVDAHGLRVDTLRAAPEARAVLVAPAHHFPTGVALAPDRRTDLIAWAREADGLILEEDKDSEFRYDARPVGALQGMAPSHVALLSSLSKTLAPALRIGWIATPARWTAALGGAAVVDQVAARPAAQAAGHAATAPPGPRASAAPPPTLDQLAFAHLIRTGAFDRHLRTARRAYRRRRDAFVAELARLLPGCPVSSASAGLHVVLRVPGVSAAAVAEAAGARGLRVGTMAEHACEPDPSEDRLVLGYGAVPDSRVAAAVAELAGAIALVAVTAH